MHNWQSKAKKIIEVMEKEGRNLLTDNSSEVWRQKPDGSFFGQKEVALEKRFCDWLLGEKMFPDAVFVGEETNAEQDLERGKINIILDPLDGSALNRRQIPVWGISLAILDEQLAPAIAIVYYPAMKRWFIALGEDGGASPYSVLFDGGVPNLFPRQNGAEIAKPPLNQKIEHAYVYVNSDPGIFNLTRLRSKIRAFGCSSYHVAALVDGQGDPLASALYGYKIYDVAAAVIVAASCRLAIYDVRKSKRIDFSEWIELPRNELDNRPLLIGHPIALSRLEGQISLAGGAGASA